MSLYERVTATDSTKIPVHTLSAYMHVVLTDAENLGSTAETRMISNLNLDAEDQTNIAAIKSKYDGLGTNVQKIEFTRRVHHALMLAEAGEITKAEAKTLLGF